MRKTKNHVIQRYFVWDGDQLLAELDSAGTHRVAEYAYYPGIDQPLALITGATTPTTFRYFKQDALGNVIGIVQSGPSVTQQITYDPWGLQGQVTGTLADTNRLRWKGLYWDSDVGLYYMRARWYDPATERFLSEDPLGLAGGLNSYIFGRNDPIDHADPSGMCLPECLPVIEALYEIASEIAVAAGISGGVYVAERGIQGEPLTGPGLTAAVALGETGLVVEALYADQFAAEAGISKLDASYHIKVLFVIPEHAITGQADALATGGEEGGAGAGGPWPAWTSGDGSSGVSGGLPPLAWAGAWDTQTWTNAPTNPFFPSDGLEHRSGSSWGTCYGHHDKDGNIVIDYCESSSN